MRLATPNLHYITVLLILPLSIETNALHKQPTNNCFILNVAEELSECCCVLGEAKMISYCGRRLLCHPKLQLYLSTSTARPHTGPVLASLSTMVSYSTDVDTLTDKLLKRAFAR